MSDTDQRLALDAPAKINLYLHVTGRRDDGYHLLDSLVAFTEFGDRILVAPDDDLTLQIDGPFAGSLDGGDDDNLVLRAARALREASGAGAGAAISLTKNLPVSSGIGGGSADAGAVLRLLARLWELDFGDVALAKTGLSIGADVPVCLAGVPCRMTGIGETISPVDPLPSCGVVLVNGGEGVSTPSVFAARQKSFSRAGEWETPARFEDFVSALRGRTNDLAAAARTVSPVIAEVLGALEASEGCALARLSGSGGTCFGLFADPALAHSARRSILAAQPGWWSASTRFRDIRPGISPV